MFLFKSTATSCIQNVWKLVRQLREHDIHCEMQRLRDPGLIIFEDSYQVAVIPSSGPSEL